MHQPAFRHQNLERISNLVQLRDNLMASERILAGRANAAGMAMRVPEKKARRAEIASWVQAGISSPGDMLMKSLTTALEHFSRKDDVTPAVRKLAETTEEMVYWGKMLQLLAKGVAATTPIGLAAVSVSAGASWAIKTTRLKAVAEAERLETVMEHFWQCAMEYKRQVPVAVADLNRELMQLQA